MYTNIIHNDDICNYFLKNQQFIFNSLGNCRECRMKMAIIATLAGANIFAAFKLGTNGRFKFSLTAAAGAILLAWMI